MGQPTTHAGASITIEQEGARVLVRPMYTLLDTTVTDSTTLRYTFSVERTGAATARSRQGGRFTPTPGRTDTLSTVRLNTQPGDSLQLHLVVRRGDQVIDEQTAARVVAPDE